MLTASRRQRTIARETEVRGVGFIEGADVQLHVPPGGGGPGRGLRPHRPGRSAVGPCPHPTCRATAASDDDPARRGERRDGRARDGRAGGLADRQLHDRDRCSRDPGVRRLEPCVRRGVDCRRVPSSRIARARPWSSTGPWPSAEGAAVLAAHPGDGASLVLGYHLDYGRNNPIGAQSFFLDVSPDSFRDELATSRTFLLEAEAHALRDAGIGKRIEHDGPAHLRPWRGHRQRTPLSR